MLDYSSSQQQMIRTLIIPVSIVILRTIRRLAIDNHPRNVLDSIHDRCYPKNVKKLISYQRPEDIRNLTQLCQFMLEPVRAMVESPIVETSRYRCNRRNSRIGGVPDSLLHFLSRIKNALFVLAWVFLLNGCAIHYFDPETGTEHLWGIGHMRMKVGEANEGVRAIVAGTDTLGVAVGSAAYDRYIALGWQRLSRLQVVGEDTAVRLEWPTSDLFSVRVGSELPDLHRDSGQKQGP